MNWQIFWTAIGVFAAVVGFSFVLGALLYTWANFVSAHFGFGLRGSVLFFVPPILFSAVCFAAALGMISNV